MSKIFRRVSRSLPSPLKKVATKIDPIYKATVGQVDIKEAAAKRDAEAARLAAMGTGAKVGARVSNDAALRQESLIARAEAAGATRVDNDYDLLGKGELTVKKKGASRALLGR